MCRIPQNPLLFGDSLWLYDWKEEILKYTKYNADKRKRNLKNM